MVDDAARPLPRIAFVFGDASLAEHVRDAVTGHADITYAAPAQDFDSARLIDARVAAALVNLDGGDWLDDIETRLDAAGVPVVFNDPDYSQALEGWDRARWLRHLTAKLSGSDDFDPPRPPAAATAPADAPPEATAPADALPEATAPADALPEATPSAPGPALPDAKPEMPSPAIDPPANASAGPGDDIVAERPLSPHEIETLTADFAAAPALHTQAASSWQPSAVTVQVSTGPFVPAVSVAPVLQAEPPPAVEQAAMTPSEPEPEIHTAPLPSEPAGAADLLDVDTEALSALIDQRLAQPEPSLGERADWDAPHADAPRAAADAPAAPAPDEPGAAGPAVTQAASMPSTAGDPDADVLARLPSLDEWALLDGDAVPEVVKPESRHVAPELPDSLANLTLVPMDPLGQDAHANFDPIERWIDEDESKATAKTKPRDDGDTA